MKNKSTEDLIWEYQIVQSLMTFHINSKPRLLSEKELEEYVNAALDMMLDIREELKKRGVEFDSKS